MRSLESCSVTPALWIKTLRSNEDCFIHIYLHIYWYMSNWNPTLCVCECVLIMKLQLSYSTVVVLPQEGSMSDRKQLLGIDDKTNCLVVHRRRKNGSAFLFLYAAWGVISELRDNSCCTRRGHSTVMPVGASTNFYLCGFFIMLRRV